MSLAFTFLCAIDLAKALTLDEILEFHRNLAGWNETGFDILDTVKKKDFIENKPEEDSSQALASKTNSPSLIISFQYSKSQLRWLIGLSDYKEIFFGQWWRKVREITLLDGRP